MNYELSDTWGSLVASNLCIKCKSCKMNSDLDGQIHKKTCLKSGKETRAIREKLEYGEIYCCSNKKEELKSTKVFRSRVEVLKDLLLSLQNFRDEIKENVNQETKRLLHNVTTLNGHSIQELYALVPQEILTQNLSSQLNIIEQEISGNISETARTFLRIAKNNAALKMEFSVFKKLFEIEPNLQIKRHFIHKVLLNLLHIFFQDFTDLGVRIKIAETQEQISIDYESIQVALYHFFDNAVKYCAPNENIVITFDYTDYSFLMRIEMLSLEIEEDELKQIFNEGYRGKNAIALNKAGNGIGLNFISRILKINNAELRISANCNPKKSKFISGHKYTYNIFEFHFNS